jgi:GH25 family lysozyme M1 (1,4-beta-N-acetylmuramidase)
MPQFPGLDCSKFQGEVDWPTAARLGRTFAFVEEFGWGAFSVNPLWHQQWDGAGAAGLVKFAYFFWRHDQNDDAQVNAWLEGARLQGGDGSCVDYEYQQPDVPGDWSSRVEYVQGRLTRELSSPPLLYSDKRWLDLHVPRRGGYTLNSGLFLAQWGWDGDVATLDLPDGWNFAAFIQDGQQSDVPTTGQPADRDWFNGPISRLHLYGKQS